MIICTNCGFRNEDGDSFCGGCQEFLEWTGEAAEPEAANLEVEEPEPEEERKGLVDRVVERFVGAEDEEGDGDGLVVVAGPEGADQPEHTGSAGTVDDESEALRAEAADRAEREAEQARRSAEQAEAMLRANAEAADRARQRAEEAAAAQRAAADQVARFSTAPGTTSEPSAAPGAEDEPGADRDAAPDRQVAEPRAAEPAEPSPAESEPGRSEPGESEPAAGSSGAPAGAVTAGADAESVEAEAVDAETVDAPPPTSDEGEAEPVAEAVDAPDADRDAGETGGAVQEDPAEAAARAEAEAARTAAREAAEAAAREAEAAEEARRLAEEQARKEAEAAERARRAAALVARPPAARPVAPPTAKAPAQRPTTAGPPRRRRQQPPAQASEEPGQETQEGARSDGPTAVKPGRSKVRPTARTREAPTRQFRPGDLICGQCGEGNAPTRNFCRRCGHELAEAEVVKQPWWKRLLPRRRQRVYAAGERPSRGIAGDRVGGDDAAAGKAGKGGKGGKSGVKGAMSGARGLRRKIMGPIGKIGRPLMFVGVALAAVGISFNPGLRGSLMDGATGAFDRVRGFIAPQYEPVTPIDVTASSSLPDHPAESAIDNTSNRWWAEGAEGNGEGESLVVTFAEPVDIAAVGVTPGAAETEEFVAQPRPRQLHLVFDTGVTADLNLSDEHEFQSFEVDAPGVTSVEVQVIEVWQGQSGSDMALTTLEFRTAS